MVTCITDHDQVVAASGAGIKDYLGKEISKNLEEVISERVGKCVNIMDRGKVPVTYDQKDVQVAQVIQPIICAGDAIGSVILMGKSEKDSMGQAEKMLVQTAAGFLGRQMEQ